MFVIIQDLETGHSSLDNLFKLYISTDVLLEISDIFEIVRFKSLFQRPRSVRRRSAASSLLGSLV
jgi:hypothetical protein